MVFAALVIATARTPLAISRPRRPGDGDCVISVVCSPPQKKSKINPTEILSSKRVLIMFAFTVLIHKPAATKESAEIEGLACAVYAMYTLSSSSVSLVLYSVIPLSFSFFLFKKIQL